MSPLLILSGFFCAGIGFAFYVRLPFVVLFFCASALSAASWLLRGRSFPAALLPLLSFSVGCCWASACQVRSVSAVSDRPWPAHITVLGTVAGEPERVRGSTRMLLDVDQISAGRKASPAHGKLLLIVKADVPYSCGDQLLSSGEFISCRAAFPFMMRNYSDHLERHGISRILECRPWSIELVKKDSGRIGSLLLKLRHRLSLTLSDRLSPQCAAMMQAMLLGEKDDVSPLITRAMIETGTIHILVVSGFNVGIVVFVLLILLRLLRVPRRLRFFFLVPGIFAYCLLTGASEPVVRAGIMAVILSGAYLFHREGDIQNAFALSLCVMLMINPRLLFDAGFQLSYVSVFGLIVVYPHLKTGLGIERLAGLFRYIADGLLVSFSAWLMTSGLIAYYFRIFTPGAILTNLLVVPLAGFITLCGFCLLLAELALPACAGLIAVTVDHSTAVLVHLASFRLGFFSLPAR
ncbi:MAG: ComEC/Rec2 family competence protein [Deltaproteobacteria bacterium]